MVMGSVQRLAGKSGERLLQWRCLCVPWRHRSSPCIGMCRVLGGGRAAMQTAGAADAAAAAAAGARSIPTTLGDDVCAATLRPLQPA